MNRRKAREYALQMLFQLEFAGRDRLSVPDDFWVGKEDKEDLKSFTQELFKGTTEHLEEIDGIIRGAAENWDLMRMATVDRNILRFAVFEIVYRQDIPSAVTINEALEIAKKYSSQESAPFINGLLDKIAKNRGKS